MQLHSVIHWFFILFFAGLLLHATQRRLQQGRRLPHTAQRVQHHTRPPLYAGAGHADRDRLAGRPVADRAGVAKRQRDLPGWLRR